MIQSLFLSALILFASSNGAQAQQQSVSLLLTQAIEEKSAIQDWLESHAFRQTQVKDWWIYGSVPTRAGFGVLEGEGKSFTLNYQVYQATFVENRFLNAVESVQKYLDQGLGIDNHDSFDSIFYASKNRHLTKANFLEMGNFASNASRKGESDEILKMAVEGQALKTQFSNTLRKLETKRLSMSGAEAKIFEELVNYGRSTFLRIQLVTLDSGITVEKDLGTVKGIFDYVVFFRNGKRNGYGWSVYNVRNIDLVLY